MERCISKVFPAITCAPVVGTKVAQLDERGASWLRRGEMPCNICFCNLPGRRKRILICSVRAYLATKPRTWKLELCVWSMYSVWRCERGFCCGAGGGGIAVGQRQNDFLPSPLFHVARLDMSLSLVDADNPSTNPWNDTSKDATMELEKRNCHLQPLPPLGSLLPTTSSLFERAASVILPQDRWMCYQL